MSFEVVKKCINQDTKKRLHPGDVVDDLSDFEKGRHLAEGNIIPFVDKKRENGTRKRRVVRSKKQ